MNCKSAGSSLVRTEPHGTGRYQTKEITGSQYLNSFRTLSLLCVSPCMFAPFSEQDPMFPLKRKVICHALPYHGVLSIVGTYEVVRVVAVIKNTVMEFLLSPFAFFLMVLDKQLILYFYVCLLQNIKSPQKHLFSRGKNANISSVAKLVSSRFTKKISINRVDM